MKNNICFFTHETNASSHRKFLILRTHYGEGDRGWAMEGRFWRLNGLIGEAENCSLDLTKKGSMAQIAHELTLDLAELDEFLAVLRDDAELINEDAGTIWTDQTQRDLARAMGARRAAKTRRDFRELGDECKTSGDESKTSGDETRGEDRIGEEEIGGAVRAKISLSSPENSKRGEEEENARAHAQEPPPPLLGKSPQTEAGGLIAYALKIAIERKAKNPETYARSLAKKPDIIAAYKALTSETTETKTKFLPDPQPCACGQKLKADLRNGFARCPGCAKEYAWDDNFEIWLEDVSQNTA